MALEKILNAIKMTALVAGLTLIIGFGGCSKKGEIEEVKNASNGKIAFISKEKNKYNIVYTNKNGKELSRFIYPAEDIPKEPLFPQVDRPSVSSIQPVEDGSFFCAGTISAYATVARWVQDETSVGDEMSTGTEKKGFLTKVSPAGKIVWTKLYGEGKPIYTRPGRSGQLREENLSDLEIKDSAIIPNQGLILVGRKNDEGYILRVDQEGNSKWEREFGGTATSIDKVCWSEPNGTVFLGTKVGDLILGKYDENGLLLWSKNMGVKEDKPLSLEQSLDGGYILAGKRDNSHLVEKTNKNGEVEWKRDFDWDVRSIMPTQDRGYILVGNQAIDKEKALITALKIDSNGNTQWQTTYKKPYATNSANCVTVVPDGYIISGSYKGNEMLIKLDNRGEVKGF